METTTPSSRNYFNKPTQGKDFKKIDGRKAGCGCLSILGLLSVPVIFFILYHTVFPELFPTWIRGNFQNLAIFPSNGKNMLLVQNDGSFSYIMETKTAGSHSIGREGLFEKTFTYFYDPVKEEVIKGSFKNLDYLPAAPEMFFINGKLWVITPSLNAPPFVDCYNPDTYEQTLNTEQFCAMSPELSSGLEKLYVDRSLPIRLMITAKDGKEVTYSIKDEKFFESYGDMSNYYKKNENLSGSIFTLEPEKNANIRKVLYYISGPLGQLYFSSPRGQYIMESKNSTNDKLTAVALLPGKAFIEAELLYFDDDIAVVIHQDNAGKNANRMLTCVDKYGKEKWTVPQEELFDEIKAEEDNAFSSIFFMKGDMAVQRSGDVVVFIYKREGALAFDLNTGKKLWEFES